MSKFVFNHSQSLLTPPLPGAVLTIFGEILSAKYPDIGPELQKLDQADEKLQRHLHQAQQEYLAFPNKETRSRLIESIQTCLRILEKQYQHAIKQQHLLSEQVAKEAQEYKTLSWKQWLISGVKKTMGSNPDQRQAHYAEIADNRLIKIKKLTDYRQQLAAEQTKSKPNNKKKLKQLLNQPPSCISTENTIDEVMGYRNRMPVLNSEIVRYRGRGTADLGNPTVGVLNNNNPYIITFDGKKDGKDIFFYSISKHESKIANNHTDGDQSYPVLASFDNGQFIIAWHSNRTTSAYDIYARCFGDNFNPLGEEFRVNNDNIGGRNWYPAISIWQNTVMIAWESDLNVTTIDFDNSTQIDQISKNSSVLAQFFTAGYDSKGNFVCHWTPNKPDVIVASPDDVGHRTGTGLTIAPFQDPKTEIAQFFISWIGNLQEYDPPATPPYIRPFSLSGYPEEYALLVDGSYGNTKTPSSIGMGNLYDGKIIILWNRKFSSYYNDTYCNPTKMNEPDCHAYNASKTGCPAEYEVNNSATYYDGSCYLNTDFACQSSNDEDIWGQVITATKSGSAIGFPLYPLTSIAISTPYNETLPVVGTFLGGNFVTLWKAVDSTLMNQFCPSNLYGRFYRADASPLDELFCVASDTDDITFGGKPRGLGISTAVSGNFIVSWIGDNLKSEQKKKSELFYLTYTNQPPAFNSSKGTQPFKNATWCKAIPAIKNLFSLLDPLSLLLTEKTETPGSVTFDLGSHFNQDPEGATVTYRIESINGFSRNISKADLILPPAYKFNSNTGGLTFNDFNEEEINHLFKITASDPHGAESSYYACVKINPKQRTLLEQLVWIWPVLASMASVGIAIWLYKFRQYKLKKYRQNQNPFANEIYELLNLSYPDFTDGPGKKYADTVTTMLKHFNEERPYPEWKYGDIEKLKDVDDYQAQLYYFYSSFLFAKKISDLNLIIPTPLCGIERLKNSLWGIKFFNSEIDLNKFKARVETLNSDVRALGLTIPSDWKKKFEEHREREDKSKTWCVDRMRKTCCPFRISDDFFRFRREKLDEDLSNSKDHKGSITNRPSDDQGVELQENKEKKTKIESLKKSDQKSLETIPFAGHDEPSPSHHPEEAKSAQTPQGSLQGRFNRPTTPPPLTQSSPVSEKRKTFSDQPKQGHQHILPPNKYPYPPTSAFSPERLMPLTRNKKNNSQSSSSSSTYSSLAPSQA